MTVRAIGMVIYTYFGLENSLDSLWIWTKAVESWTASNFSEFYFSPRGKESKRIYLATKKNLEKLFCRLMDEEPWYLVSFGLPKGTLNNSTSNTHGVDVTWFSAPQPSKRTDASRKPSYVYIIATPDYFQKGGKIDEFINLGVKAWEILRGVYGYIDIETLLDPNDKLMKDFGRLMSDLIPADYFQEFRQWQDLSNKLDRKLWKVFWGNFLGEGHIQQVGGLRELRRADYYRPLPEIEKTSWEKGRQTLEGKAYQVVDLPYQGCFLRLSSSPLDLYEKVLQTNQHPLQDVLAPISII